jgi:hypothetical protein
VLAWGVAYSAPALPALLFAAVAATGLLSRAVRGSCVRCSSSSYL